MPQKLKAGKPAKLTPDEQELSDRLSILLEKLKALAGK